MGKIAFVFPGQGAQYVGMGHDVYKANPAAQDLFDRADRALDFALTDVIFNGPEEELKRTVNTQPALLAASLALLEAFKAAGVRADYVAGHSLGEYSALVAAGVIAYDDAVTIVRARGRYMEEAVPGGQGAMAAVLGAERNALADLCADITATIGVVEPANVNCPGQIVVSGSREGVQAFGERSKEIGAKRVIPLVVSGPFHSSLMKPASERLQQALQGLTMSPAQIPVVANVTAEAVHEPEQIRRLLIEQVYSPVLWEDTVLWLIAQGVDTFFEIGPGNVLVGLIKKTDKNVKLISIDSLEAITKYTEEANN